MSTRQNKKTDPKTGPESRDKSGRERAGEKSARQQERDTEGQSAGKRGTVDEPQRGTGRVADWDDDAETEQGSEGFERVTEDEAEDEDAPGRPGVKKPAERRPKGGS